MKGMRFGFLGAILTALVWVGCCSGPDPEREKREAAENRHRGTGAKLNEPLVLNGRILDLRKEFPGKAGFESRWGFRATGEGEIYILKAYPEEFDQGMNPGFMHKRRAKLKLHWVGGGPNGKIAEVLDVMDISKRLDGN